MNAAIEKARTAAGVSRRSRQIPEVDSRRTNNTIRIVHTLRSELGIADPARIVAEYKVRFSRLRSDRQVQAAGGILTPKALERLLGSSGEQR